MSPRKRLIALLSGLLALLLAGFGIGFVATTNAPPEAAASSGSPETKEKAEEPDESDLDTLSLDEDDAGNDADTGSDPGSGTDSGAGSRTPGPGDPAPRPSTPADPQQNQSDPSDPGLQLPTLPVADTTPPAITVKPESKGGPAAYASLSLKLYDAGQVDSVTINGTPKDLSNNQWSDVNALVVGSFGIQDGVPFTVVAFDVAGNSSTATFTLDGTGPTITVKPESKGGPAAYSSLSLKLYDAFKVDYVVVNGVTKDLTDNNWSDVNGITVGSFGIQDGVPFTVVAFDVAGNSSTATFILDGTGPTVTVKPESTTESLSLKLYDRFKVDYIIVNGVTKDLTDNQWADANSIRVGNFGIVAGVPFDVVVFDTSGNSTTATYTLDAPAVAARFAAAVEVAEEPALEEDAPAGDEPSDGAPAEGDAASEDTADEFAAEELAAE